MKQQVSQRPAQDGYHAQLIAQGMENAGAEVFSVTNDGNGNIVVYCKYRDTIDEGWIDHKVREAVTARAAYYAAV